MIGSRYDRKKRQERRKRNATIIDMVTIVASLVVLLIGTYGICSVKAAELPEDFHFDIIEDKNNKQYELFEMRNRIQYSKLVSETEIESESEAETETEYESETESEIETETELETEYLGEFCITAYCACAQCCGKSDGITASGKYVEPYYTIAVDPSVIPLGTLVMIDDNIYEAQDTGGGVGGSHIDIYMESHSDALNFGVQYKDVYMIV